MRTFVIFMLGLHVFNAVANVVMFHINPTSRNRGTLWSILIASAMALWSGWLLFEGDA